MARTVNEQEYAVKRAEILAVTRRLLYTRGYDQLTIKDIIDALQISKGAFYHYFDSKQALLEALIDRMRQEGEQVFDQIISDPDLPTLARLQRFFDTVGRWKVEQKPYVLALIRGWYADDNAIVRLRVQETMLQHIAPLLGQAIAQGVHEGELTTAFPDLAAAIILTLSAGLADAIARLLLAPEPRGDAIPVAERLAAAYNDAMERVLGARPGSLHLMSIETTRAWFVAGGEV